MWLQVANELVVKVSPMNQNTIGLDVRRLQVIFSSKNSSKLAPGTFKNITMCRSVKEYKIQVLLHS